jgi:hypothetical protein
MSEQYARGGFACCYVLHVNMQRLKVTLSNTFSPAVLRQIRTFTMWMFVCDDIFHRISGFTPEVGCRIAVTPSDGMVVGEGDQLRVGDVLVLVNDHRCVCEYILCVHF